jgi:hypothetical protein
MPDCTTTFFDDIYIPTQDDCDAYYSGKVTLEELHKEFDRRQSIASQSTIDTDETVATAETSDPVEVVVEAPITRETLYYEKGSKDKLKNVCDSNEVLVSRDANDKGAKAYQIVAWDKWLKKTARYDTSDYECLRGNVYPYMDIESEKDGIDVVEMLNHSIGLFIDALLANGIAVNGVAIANSSRPGKTSFHVVIHTDKVFESTLTLKEFIMQHIKPNFDKNVSDELMQHLRWLKLDKKTNNMISTDCIDWAVYTTDRVMRFLNQSKLGKKVRLTPYINNDIIVPCKFLTAPQDYLIGQYGQSAQKPLFVVELPEYIKKVKEAKEAGIVAPMVVLEESYLSELADIIPTEIIQSGTTCCKFIWALARSGASNDLIHNNCKRTSNYDKEWVDYHIAHSATMNVNIGTLRYWASQADKKAYHTLSKKYMKQELNNEIHSFQTVIKSTQYNERYVRPFSFEKVDTLLLKSHLGTGKTTQLVNSIKAQKRFLQSDFIPFKRILIVSGRKSFTKFICGDLDECKLGFKAYDERHNVPLASIDRLVIQVESLWRLEDGFAKYDLVAIDESETVAHQFYSEATHRQNMIRNHIVFERCISTATKVWFADAFLSNRTIKIAEALRNVEHAEIVENTFCPYERKAIQLQSIHKGKQIPALSEFCDKIVSDLKAGLKVAVVWGSKNKAKAFADTLLKETDYKWKLYTSESSADDRNDLSNVEEAWKNVDCLNYTSTITVGVNYDPADPAVQFDKLYLYASASGGLPRDIAQALLRCRKIKSNTLIYTVDTNALQTAIYGRDAIRVAIEDKQQRILQHNPVLTWEKAPKWAEENYIENENENGAKCIAFNEILNGYLEKSGYTITKEIVKNDADFELKTEELAFDDIADVEDEVIESIKRKSKAGFATYDEKMILQKHRFKQQLTVTDATVLKELWAKYMMDKSQEICFWNMVNEKHQTTNDYLQHESKQKYIQSSSKKCLKRIALDKVLAILKIKNTAEKFEIDTIEPLMESFKAVEEEVFKAFQPHASRRKGEFKQSTAIDMLQMVFKGWCGTELDTTKKRKGRQQIITYAIKNQDNPVWNYITKRDSEVE